MLYLIGLGLNGNGISKEGLLALDKCKKVFLESYTVDFPYSVDGLKLGKKKIIPLKREDVESNMLIKEARSIGVALLIYGSPLFATTHLTLLKDAQEQGVTTHIIYSASVFDALGETGLQLYKFGKITSMPRWNTNTGKNPYEPDSFMDVVRDNQSIKAHTLILTDIGLRLDEALLQLAKASKNKDIVLEKIAVCSRMGTSDSKIYYDTLENLKLINNIEMPFCIIIPGELHFVERAYLEKIAQ